jgi:lipoic acid synthetase
MDNPPLPLVQLAARRGGTPGMGETPVRKPNWLKVKSPGGETYAEVRRLMRDLKLHTVCEEAHCPNVGDCWNHRAATFLILGDVCTRNCAYCAVAHGTPEPLDREEPRRLAEAVEAMRLRHVVVTSVDRDDLPDGGAGQYAAVVREIRRRMAETTVELLIPDFKGDEAALRLVVEARPDILNHNLETVPRLYRLARPGGRYERALELLRRAKAMDPLLVTKSGIMVGLGETWEEAVAALRDLRAVGVDLVTVGQYLRPSDAHLPVARFWTPDEFGELRRLGMAMGFRHVESGPLVRSSFHAWEQAERVGATR